jgi:predicted SprT family Zn-dependent metalloprotease
MKKKFEYIFLTVILSALSFLAYNTYKSYTFSTSPLPQSYKEQIEQKENEVVANMQKHFGVAYRFPIVVTDKIPGRLYGLTSYENGKITIYLNKKVMQESFEYMISDVIAHEYAHALLFKLHQYHSKNDGHSKVWKETCQALGGKNCQQYVNQKEIILSKMPF